MTYVINPYRFGGAWTPNDLSGSIQFWYEVGDITDFWQDSARTSQVTADGQSVGAWDDISGNGNHLLQATAGYQPVYQSTYIDFPDESATHPTIEHYMAADDAANMTSNGDESLIGVAFKPNQYTFTNYSYFSIGSQFEDSNPAMTVNQGSSTNVVDIYIDGARRYTGLAYTPGSLVRVVLRVTKPATNWLVDVWYNGSKQTQYDASTFLSNWSGSDDNVYVNSGYQAQPDAHWFCAIMAKGTYTDGDAEDLDGYLASFG